MAKKQKKLEAKTPRNWHAVNAHDRSSAGVMKGLDGDRKKEESRKACRGKQKGEG